VENTVIFQTNQALRYYENNDDIIKGATPTASSDDGIYVNGNAAYKVKKYSGSLVNETWGVLLWSGATNKKATMEIKPAATGNDYTVTVDWNGLTINAE
jgi:hypothetical protein